MQLNTPSSPHIHSGSSVSAVMRRVLLALIPAILTYVWCFGWGVVVNLVLATLVALACEALMLSLRQRPIKPFLSDYSAVLTAWLLAIALPPYAPWWLTVIGVSFAMIFAKHLYGGLGYNPFNPAMVGYVLLLISFPREMTSWGAPLALIEQAPSLSDAITVIFHGAPANLAMDAITMATPLDHLKTELKLEHSVGSIISGSELFASLGGTGWQWVNLAILAGGLWLIHKKLIAWQIPVGMLGALTLIAGLFYLIDPEHYASPLFHLFTGATMLGAFFIATDPVTASTTPRGRLYYGIGIGVLVFVIRAWGGYPDGVAFAVLLMNIAAPTLDQYTLPRVFGGRK